MVRAISSAFLAISTMAALIGCGGQASDQPPLGKVSGLVKMDGQPLPNVLVTFQPSEGGRPSHGVTDSSGRYTLMYNSESGAKIGSHKISVLPNDELSEDPKATNTKISILPKYNTQTELSRDVVAGNNEIDLDLTSK